MCSVDVYANSHPRLFLTITSGEDHKNLEKNEKQKMTTVKQRKLQISSKIFQGCNGT